MQEVKRTLLELIVVTVMGLVFGLAGNAVSKDGLSLTRKYFHRPVSDDLEVENGGAGLDAVDQRLLAQGLTPISFEDVVATFEDPLHEAGAYIFVDARDDKHYADGHIPGALQLDYYRILEYIDAVLPHCEGAQQIVVYCNGGECEDSESVALALRDEFGVAQEKLFVFAGGIEEWVKQGRQVEVGPRFSGELRSNIK